VHDIDEGGTQSVKYGEPPVQEAKSANSSTDEIRAFQRWPLLARLQPWLYGATLTAIAWCVAVWLTSGFYWQYAFFRVSSRDPVRPFIIAAICGFFSWLVDPPRAAAATARFVETQMPRVVWFVFVLGLVLLVGQWSVGRPFWTDEEMLALSIRDRTFLDLARPLALDQSAPYGWLVLERLALLTLGASEQALRLVPVLFGVALLIVALWTGRRWMTGIGTAALLLCCAMGEWLTFYCLELKPYSSDMFWALLLPALAGWVVEGPDDRRVLLGRAALWWTIAALGLWFGNGALFVAPGCALVLLVGFWRRGGWRLASRFCAIGFVWLVSFGADYVVSLRPTLNDSFMAGFWQGAMPPRSAGFVETVRWVAAQFHPLAVKPGGADGWIAFWIVAAGGFALLVRTYPSTGLLFALTPIAAFVLAAFRVVPLYERLSIWIVPSLYLGIAYTIDGLTRVFAGNGTFRRSKTSLLTAALAVGGLAVTLDLVNRGFVNVWYGRPIASNHQLDDRAALADLLTFHRPGDAFMATRLALPAVWWYGGIPGGAWDSDASRHPDGGRIWRVSFVPSAPDCQPDDVLETLEDGRRLLVYFGFRFDDTPGGFDMLLMDRLRQRGRIVSDRSYAELSRAVVVELRRPDGDSADVPEPAREGAAGAAGCITVAPATTARSSP
jgi:hypothetical protein